MTTGPISTEQIADLILRGEETGWLPLSEVVRLGDGLPQGPLEALYERLDAHGIEVRNDCGRPAAPRAYANGALTAARASLSWLLLGEIPPFPLLTAGEELELAMDAERGDRRSKERLINANIRLVVSIAMRHQGRGVSPLNLVRAGILGLARAVDTFDWRLGHRFASYATWCVLQSVHQLEHGSRCRAAHGAVKAGHGLRELVA